ncbi:MAG: hypothetical protein CM15mL2_2260 [Caudoviricetes sp.]|jgi:hypothetical protein|nr:MAG: hypothetical protein CM15mL2_2260 [Caudoviricetes sp.]
MAETRTLSQFKSKLIGGGTRPNLFEVSIPTFPSAISEAWSAGDDSENGIFKFLCKATALPASNLGSIEIPFRGRTLKVAGDRTFDDWTVTIINDEDFKLRTAFERWSNVMSRLDDATGVTNPTSYMTDGYVQQLGRGSQVGAASNDGGESSVLRSYKFFDVFPITVGEIALSYDTTDALEEFDVTFRYQYFTIGNSAQSSGGTGEVLIT